MVNIAERKLNPRPTSFDGNAGIFSIDSPNLKLVYKQNTPFWKKKRFLFSILISCAVLGVLTLFVVDAIYNREHISNIIYNSSYQKIESLVKPLENSRKSSRVIQQRTRRFQTNLEDIQEQEIFVTCELNNGIKELNNEIKRLYDSLTRLDARVNRDKRGLNEQTAIVDCVQMKGKFQKIYEDLSRISETLSMIDENGICRCKCPLPTDKISTEVINNITEVPFDLLTTFILKSNSDELSGSNENLNQSKKIDSENNSQKVMNNNIISKYRGTTETANEVNKFTSTLMPNVTPVETDTTTETIDDMSPAMSNAVTNFLNVDGFTEMTKGKTLYYTDYNDKITKENGYEQIITSEISKSLTEITDLNETTETTVFNYNKLFSMKDESPGTEIITENENILKPVTTTSNPVLNNNNTYATETTYEITSENENNLESTTEISNSNNIYINTYVTKNTYESTSENKFVPNSSTELSVLIENDVNTDVMERTFKTTFKNEYVSVSTSELSVFEIYENEKMLQNKNIKASTTSLPDFDDNNSHGNANERHSSQNQNKNIYHDDKSKDGIIYQSKAGKPTDVENKTTSKPQYNYDHINTPHLETMQPKWYPICFYPIPCSPNLSNYQQNTQDTSKNTIQYSAQSLRTYKKKLPLADATVIQNNYPIISYCPLGMACPMIDFVGQANILHCMLKSKSPDTVQSTTVDVNKNNSEIISSRKLTNTKFNNMKNDSAVEFYVTKDKILRDSDEIFTGDLECPSNTFPCVDNSKCVDADNWCDGRIHCNDASDESQCKCKERIDKDKLCDGYYDCPSGEDELGCFGCNNETFSCGDWNIVSQRSSCFEKQYRCDNIVHCPNGRDEDECTLLSRHLENPEQIFFISYSTGYLHHNWKGNWYPMCDNNQIELWAEKACTVESGEKSKPITVKYKNEMNTFGGPFISIGVNNQITLLSSCKYQGILVECEPEVCGIRADLKFIKNIDPDRMKRSSSYSNNLNNVTSRFVRSKDPRVVGGIASNPGAWPWLIALYQDGIFHCGGVILSEQWVLTAAHCVNQYQKHFYEVQAGILRRFSFSPMEQSRIVTHIIAHTQYSRTTMENDLAVLRLERSLEFNRWIRPVCLPDSKLSWIPFPGTICTAVGWGATVEHGPDPDNMREVEVPILPECTHKTDIDGKEICAGYLIGGHDTCQGDSGGPLLCREPSNLNKWYVAGIVSHGEGCARPMEPGVYTRVALYMDWIVKVTDEENLPNESPQQSCPGILCKSGKQCIPSKRQCDKYVDCMNAEDEQNCDYTGSQYNVNLYRSRNTDHSNFKYSRLKSAEEEDTLTNVTLITPKEGKSTSSPNLNSTIRNQKIKIINQTNEVEVNKNNKSGLNDTVLNVINNLFDNQFADETFNCKRITQVVISNHRCDGTVDCEDGTDEELCDCRTRLANMYNSSAICDGVVDCYDGADEIACGAPRCKTDENMCSQSKKCIKKSAWCDGVVDCDVDASDEKYCTAITNGTTAVLLDATGRPTFRRSGIVAINKNGVWKVQCVNENTATKIAHETCMSLNFLNSEYYEKRISWNNPLPLNVKKLKMTDMCHGLYVECGSRKTVDAKLYHWHADILVDGKLTQSGVLILDSWVLVKRTCLNLQKSYVTIVLGSGTYSSIWIKSPYEQILRVDGIKKIPNTDLDLLHLASSVTISRGVTPLGIPLFQPSLRANDTCYAVGYYYDGHGNKTEITYLQPDLKQQCGIDNICFTVTQKPQSCSSGKNTSHVTAVICESNFGLFLATPMVQHRMQICDRNALIQLPAAEDLMNVIASIIDENIKLTPAATCNGKRCQLGECIPWERVCDGIPDCRDEQDETIRMCQLRTDKCKTNDTLCICDVGSFRCKNGKCVEKTKFCDGIDNCGDGTDEPNKCLKNTCVEYLKVTAPERLCDGRWDCLDKTDEEFANCPGYCNRTNVYQCQSSNRCISSELVCDGEKDCPEADDEAECIGLNTTVRKNQVKNEGILAIRSYGNWHAQCITEDYTDIDYHSLCKGLGFKHAVGIRKTTSSKVDFENFTIVQLNPNTEVTIRSATKNILRFTRHSCTTMYVVCS